MQSIPSRAVIVSFKESLESDSRFANATLRRIVCTDQEGAAYDALEELMTPYDHSGPFMVGGNGAVVRVRSGKVVDAVRCAAVEGVDKMTAVTRKAMSAHPTEESGANSLYSAQHTNSADVRGRLGSGWSIGRRTRLIKSALSQTLFPRQRKE